MRLKELDKFEKFMEAHRGDKKFGEYSWIKKNIVLSPQVLLIDCDETAQRRDY
jgi:hypothetical protein